MTAEAQPSRQQLALERIRLDGDTQSRAELNETHVAELTEALPKLPPVVVFSDGTDHWLADGFHRFHAFRRAKRKQIPCEVWQGSQRDAVLFSVSANATHGLRRTGADKRRAIETLLRDPEWSKRSDRWIALQCCVGNQLVGDVRAQVCDSHSPTREGTDGKKRKAKPPKRKLRVCRPRAPKTFEAAAATAEVAAVLETVLEGWPADADLSPLVTQLQTFVSKITGDNRCAKTA